MGYYFNDPDRAIESKDDTWSPAETLSACLTFWPSPLNMHDKHWKTKISMLIYWWLVTYWRVEVEENDYKMGIYWGVTAMKPLILK
jgi:hypothetical protein